MGSSMYVSTTDLHYRRGYHYWTDRPDDHYTDTGWSRTSEATNLWNFLVRSFSSFSSSCSRSSFHFRAIQYFPNGTIFITSSASITTANIVLTSVATSIVFFGISLTFIRFFPFRFSFSFCSLGNAFPWPLCRPLIPVNVFRRSDQRVHHSLLLRFELRFSAAF